MGYGGGFGFRFRGYTPPYPFIGRGRGGLPRCLYPGLWGVWAPYLYDIARFPPFYIAYPKIAQEEELTFLKEWEKALKSELDAINARIKELEAKKE